MNNSFTLAGDKLDAGCATHDFLLAAPKSTCRQGPTAEDAGPNHRKQKTSTSQMSESIFVEVDFFVLVVFSIILPAGIYGYMMWKSTISRKTVLLFGVILIAISGIDVYLLQRLAEMAKISSSLLDHRIFASELSIALYLLPVVFAGIGVNMMSHILISHLVEAERRLDRERG